MADNNKWIILIIIGIVILFFVLGGTKVLAPITEGKQDEGITFKVFGRTADGQIIELKSIAKNPDIFSVVTQEGGIPSISTIIEIMVRDTIESIDDFGGSGLAGRNLRIRTGGTIAKTVCDGDLSETHTTPGTIVYDIDNDGTPEKTTYDAYSPPLYVNPTDCNTMKTNNPYNSIGNIQAKHDAEAGTILYAQDQVGLHSIEVDSDWINIETLEFGYLHFSLDVTVDSFSEVTESWELADTTAFGSVIINIQPPSCSHWFQDGSALNECSDDNSFRGKYCMTNLVTGFSELVPGATTHACGCCITTDPNYPECTYTVSGDNCVEEGCGATPLNSCEYPYVSFASIKKCIDVSGNAVLEDYCNACRYDSVPTTVDECTTAGGIWDAILAKCDQCPTNWYGDLADGCQTPSDPTGCKIKGRKGTASATIGMSSTGIGSILLDSVDTTLFGFIAGSGIYQNNPIDSGGNPVPIRYGTNVLMIEKTSTTTPLFGAFVAGIEFPINEITGKNCKIVIYLTPTAISLLSTTATNAYVKCGQSASINWQKYIDQTALTPGWNTFIVGPTAFDVISSPPPSTTNVDYISWRLNTIDLTTRIDINNVYFDWVRAE